MSLTALVVRTFAVGEASTRLMQMLEVPAVPVRGHRLTVPGGPGPLVVERVILHSRPAEGWEPGIVAAPHVEVELSAEPGDGLDAATERGWKPVQAS